MDRGAWRATAHRVAKSRIQLSTQNLLLIVKGWHPLSSGHPTFGHSAGSQWLCRLGNSVAPSTGELV